MIRRSNYVQARALLHAREKSAAAGDTTGSVRQAAKKTAGKVGRRFGAALTGAFVAADAVRPISESATKSLKSISKTPRLQSQAIKYASAGGRVFSTYLSSEQITRPFGERVRRRVGRRVGGLSAKGGVGRIALLAAAIPTAMYISEKIQDRATIPSKKKLNTILERDSNGIIAAEHERDPMKVWDFYKVLHKANPEMMGEPTTALPILESTLRTGAVTYSDIDTLLRARETAAKIVKTKFDTVLPLVTLLNSAASMKQF